MIKNTMMSVQKTTLLFPGNQLVHRGCKRYKISVYSLHHQLIDDGYISKSSMDNLCKMDDNLDDEYDENESCHVLFYLYYFMYTSLS